YRSLSLFLSLLLSLYRSFSLSLFLSLLLSLYLSISFSLSLSRSLSLSLSHFLSHCCLSFSLVNLVSAVGHSESCSVAHYTSHTLSLSIQPCLTRFFSPLSQYDTYDPRGALIDILLSLSQPSLSLSLTLSRPLLLC